MNRAAPFLGAGFSYRAPYRLELLQTEPAPRPDVLELVPDHFFARPALVEELAERYPIVLHDVGLSLGTPGSARSELGKARLRRIRELALRCHSSLVSDHLAVTHSERIAVGHLLPVWRTRAALDILCDNVRDVMDVLQLPFLVENIAAPFEIPGAQASEPEFMHELVERTGAGLLLDVSNLAANAENFGRDPRAEILQYPLEAAQQVHLAGYTRSDGRRIDSHAAAVGDDSYELLALLAGRAHPRALIIERDADLSPFAELVAEASRARSVWENAESKHGR